jgi:hypothetical protein
MEPSSRSSAEPLLEISSISSKPSQVKPTDNRLYSMSRPAWRAPKAISLRPWSVIVMVARPQRSKMIAIPNVGLDDPPPSDELAVRRRAHAGVASSLGNRARL